METPFDLCALCVSVVKFFLAKAVVVEFPAMPRRPKPAAGDDARLTDVARTIGSTLGTAKVRAEQVVEGIKAAAKAGADAYTGTASPASKSARRSTKSRRSAKTSRRRAKKK
jgi:hypothetical protein